MRQQWQVVLDSARKIMDIAKDEAERLRCRRTTTVSVDHGGFDLREQVRCVRDRDHDGPCIHHESELEEAHKETA